MGIPVTENDSLVTVVLVVCGTVGMTVNYCVDAIGVENSVNHIRVHIHYAVCTVGGVFLAGIPGIFGVRQALFNRHR